jgi:cysteine desulfurase
MSVKLPIYLDHNATTPVDPRVFEAMRPYFMDVFGNAASKAHPFGWAAEAAVDNARVQVAKLINGKPDGVIWTSGSTESNNLAIKGVARRYREKGRHIITQTSEHKAVLDVCKKLQCCDGCEITWLQVDRRGRIDLDELRRAFRPDTILVSIMWANNEIGTIHPIHEIGALCRQRDVLFHTDATQAVGKIPVDVEAGCVDLLSFTGHKIYGPKGCGALYVRHKPRVELDSLIDGGGHERGYRSGTLNVPGIVGVGAACDVAMNDMPRDAIRLAELRDRLQNALVERIDNIQINGDCESRLPHMTNLTFGGTDPDTLTLATCDVAVSAGSACTSHNMESSYVLRACGVPHELAACSIRFSLGRGTTDAEIDFVIDQMSRTLRRTTSAVA